MPASTSRAHRAVLPPHAPSAVTRRLWRAVAAVAALLSLAGVATSTAAAADTTPPSVPQGEAFTAVTQTTVGLRWSKATDNVGVVGYRLYRDGRAVGTTTGLAYLFTGLSCATSYTFALEAYDAAGNTSNRAEATGTTRTTACTTTPAPAPQPPAPQPPAPRPPVTGSASLFVTRGGSDGRACTKAAPCASLGRAYALARPGAIVEVAAGTYPSQVILAQPGHASGADVVFRPAAGARVVLGGLSFGTGDAPQGPDRITVAGMHTTTKPTEPGQGNQASIWVGPGSSYITLRDMDAGSVNTWFADHVTVKGGDYGPCHAVWGAANVCGNTKFDVSTNVTVDGAVFHDYRFDQSCFRGGADCHWECMYVNGSQNTTIRNSRFYRCAIFDIFATISGPDAAKLGHRNLTIVNNWFNTPWTEDASGGRPARPTAVSLAWCQNATLGYRDVLVGFNSFAPNTMLEVERNASCRFGNVRVIGNYMMWDGCQPHWLYAFNVWSTAWRSGRCGATDRSAASFPYRNTTQSAAMDFHLTGSAPGDNRVPIAIGCPATDIDGQARPRVGMCDAGSDER
jgi:hypothetical protein